MELLKMREVRVIVGAVSLLLLLLIGAFVFGGDSSDGSVKTKIPTDWVEYEGDGFTFSYPPEFEIWEETNSVGLTRTEDALEGISISYEEIENLQSDPEIITALEQLGEEDCDGIRTVMSRGMEDLPEDSGIVVTVESAEIGQFFACKVIYDTPEEIQHINIFNGNNDRNFSVAYHMHAEDDDSVFNLMAQVADTFVAL